MPANITITIDGREIETEPGQTILKVCQKEGIPVPTLCHFKGIGDVGACRLCLVEIEGVSKLFPACATPVAPNHRIKTVSEKLQRYRRMVLELFFVERNHVCAVCVANGNCELQNLAAAAGMSHVRFPYLYPPQKLDGSHPRFVMDHNRCILCTRCVRVCDEVEGAHSWDVKGRGVNSGIIQDFDQPWGQSTSCTWCGKCIEACPTGALWKKGVSQGQFERHAAFIPDLVEKRGAKV